MSTSLNSSEHAADSNLLLEIDDEKIEIHIENDYTNCHKISVESNNILYKEFFEKYMIKNLPCIVKNISSNWECVDKWVKDDKINYEYLTTRYGHLQAPVADCNNLIYNNSHCKTNMKVSEYMDYLKHAHKDKLMYLKDWHLRRTQPNDIFYKVPVIFSSDWLNEFAQDQQADDYMFVYIGAKDTWTPLHADVFCSYSWSVNVSGRKKWILFPPGQEIKLQDKLGNLPVLFNSEKYNDIHYFEIIQEKGDGIFVPSGWYHQVVNVLDTISINHNWINGCNIDYVWEALQKNIISVEHEIEEFKHTEEFPSQCQLILKSVFGMDFNMFINFISHIGNKRLGLLQSENFERYSKNFYGIKHIKFDLYVILKLINGIVNHNLFSNKTVISVETENEIIKLKNNILEQIDKCQS